MHIDASNGVYYELSDYFSFMAENFQWSPKYRNKIWDGRIRLYALRTNTLYIGLLPKLVKFCRERGYKIEFVDDLGHRGNLTDQDIIDYAKEIEAPYEPHDYQATAVKLALNEKRLLVLSPTGSGKSFIIYLIARYLLDHGLVNKILIIVPTITLVSQMCSDFNDYCHGLEPFMEQIHIIMGGKEKVSNKRIFVSTWQSIFQMPKKYFEQFDCAFGDEAHLCAAKSLTTITENLTNARYRIATTGTLRESKVNELQLVGMWGRIHQTTTTAELIEQGKLSDFDVTFVLLNYPDEIKNAMYKKEYGDEIDFIITHRRRNKLIAALTQKLKGNTLILFRRVQHGKDMYRMLKEMYPDRYIFFVDGSVSGDDRETHRKTANAEEDAIGVCSMQTFATGINMKNLHNLILGHPIKSKVTVLQGIGRVLRKADNGQKARLYDLVDNLKWKNNENYALTHGKERYRYYASEKFNVKSARFNL